MRWILLLLLIGACATTAEGPLSPDRCRALGVNVQDGDTVTGIIEERHQTSDQMVIRKQCRVPFDPNRRGCILVSWIGNDGQGFYDLWYMDEYDLRHEECHGYYEEWKHISRVKLMALPES